MDASSFERDLRAGFKMLLWLFGGMAVTIVLLLVLVFYLLLTR